MPVGGWPMPSKTASPFYMQVDVQRRNLALNRGLVTARILVPPAPVEESFSWLLAPPEPLTEGAKWYIDGSLINAELHGAGRTGFAIVIVDHLGGLIGFGNGTPPSWIKDAAGAESWAFYQAALNVLQLQPIA
jgi:hypothetical protein